jgi:hypothetical protein
MKSIALLLTTGFFLAAPALADSRVFIISSQADGYGIDRCLAGGEKCGASAASAYCKSREFAQATAFRRVDPDEITGSVPRQVAGGNAREEYVAITCQR